MRRYENSQASSKTTADPLVIPKNRLLPITPAHHVINCTRLFATSDALPLQNPLKTKNMSICGTLSFSSIQDSPNILPSKRGVIHSLEQKLFSYLFLFVSAIKIESLWSAEDNCPETTTSLGDR
jgi:hypothetical protein